MEHKKYRSIERLKPKNIEDFRIGDTISITEKIDGANCGIRYDEENDCLVAQSRKHILTPQNNLQGFYEFIQKLDKNRFIKYNGYIICGEWLVSHSIRYKQECYKQMYMFDVYDIEKESYLSQDRVKEISKDLELPMVKEFYYGEFISWEHIQQFVGQSDMAINGGEGVVVKRQNRRNDKDEPHYVKIVTDDFAEKKKVKIVDPEKLKEREKFQLLTETIVTKARVMKKLHELVEDGIIPTDWDEHDMRTISQNIPSMIYHDCVKEENEIVEQIENFGKFSGSTAMKHVKEILQDRSKI